MEKGEGGVVGEVVEPAELDCRVVCGEGGNEGDKSGDGGDKGEDDTRCGVGRRR